MKRADLDIFRDYPIGLVPACLESEGLVLSSVLCGYCSPSDLAPLKPESFFSDWNRLVFTAMVALSERGELAELDNVARELDRMHIVGPIRDELRALRDCQPTALGAYLRSKVACILERALERRLLVLMGRISARIRIGELSIDAARAELNKFFAEHVG